MEWVQHGLLCDSLLTEINAYDDCFRYGSAHDGYLVANYTLEGMLWLAQYEFAMPERESKLGTLMWPEW